VRQGLRVVGSPGRAVPVDLRQRPGERLLARGQVAGGGGGVLPPPPPPPTLGSSSYARETL
jgi:hypothetical protein